MATVASIQYDVNTDTWTRADAAEPAPAPEASVPNARQVWRQAVAAVAAQARTALPDANGRIDRAVKLVLGGDVQVLDDDTAMVGSVSDPATTYHVNGQCQCQDAERAPHGGMCQHKIARGLAIRAQMRLEHLMTHHDATPAPAQHGEGALPEAPASANAFVMIDGHRVQVTVRGHTLAGVLTELRQVLTQYPASPQHDAPPTTPAGPPPCPTHGAAKMKASTKVAGQRYCAAKDGEVWCTYKVQA